MLRSVPRHIALVTLLLAAVVGGCGEDEPSTTSAPAETGIEHVHGLGVDPADDSLVIATHTGLFRSPEGSRTAERIGDRRQDTMGFTVVGPERYLGSGHPDLRDDLPPLLGLIRSTDGGESWKPVSLLGEADFHVLRASGQRVLGINSLDGRLLVSEDAGRTWRRETLPEPLTDIAFHPDDPRRLAGTGEDGFYVSPDAGASWRRVSAGAAGLIAWPAADRLFLVDGSGRLGKSSDGGRHFEDVGATGAPPAAFEADGEDLYLATHDNRILVSRDGGRSWETRVAV